MNIRRTGEMCQLEKAIIQMIFKDTERTPDDGQWRSYKKEFVYEKKEYTVTCSFKVSNQYLTYRNMVITEKPKTIFLH